MKENYNVESKERRSTTPYVVSADIQLLLKPWSERNDFTLPNRSFFDQLRIDFSTRMQLIFPGFELVSEDELTNGLTEMIKTNGVTPVSLDRVYYRSEPSLDLARIVDGEGRNKGVGRRADSPVLLAQFRELTRRGLAQVALVDDVIFTGDMLERVSGVLEKMGIAVPLIYAGIGIGEGIEKLSQNGRKVLCVKEYPEVIDEICERDFYPGVPLSGRRVNTDDNTGVPYILPFGDPGGWASIPRESQGSLSRFCLIQTIKLFNEIEDVSGKLVTCSDLERKVIGLPKDKTRFVDALSAAI
ncbi:MAG: hypothetical protein ACR2LN_07225 [Candidatus Levyibacteriota bacterium]